MIDCNIGDKVWVDGYTSMAQCNACTSVVTGKEHRFDEKTGESFPIYQVNDRWYDGRNGDDYNNKQSVYYIASIKD